MNHSMTPASPSAVHPSLHTSVHAGFHAYEDDFANAVNCLQNESESVDAMNDIQQKAFTASSKEYSVQSMSLVSVMNRHQDYRL